MAFSRRYFMYSSSSEDERPVRLRLTSSRKRKHLTVSTNEFTSIIPIYSLAYIKPIDIQLLVHMDTILQFSQDLQSWIDTAESLLAQGANLSVPDKIAREYVQEYKEGYNSIEYAWLNISKHYHGFDENFFLSSEYGEFKALFSDAIQYLKSLQPCFNQFSKFGKTDEILIYPERFARPETLACSSSYSVFLALFPDCRDSFLHYFLEHVDITTLVYSIFVYEMCPRSSSSGCIKIRKLLYIIDNAKDINIKDQAGESALHSFMRRVGDLIKKYVSKKKIIALLKLVLSHFRRRRANFAANSDLGTPYELLMSHANLSTSNLVVSQYQRIETGWQRLNFLWCNKFWPKLPMSLTKEVIGYL
jgi:hypothetical protein